MSENNRSAGQPAPAADAPTPTEPELLHARLFPAVLQNVTELWEVILSSPEVDTGLLMHNMKTRLRLMRDSLAPLSPEVRLRWVDFERAERENLRACVQAQIASDHTITVGGEESTATYNSRMRGLWRLWRATNYMADNLDTVVSGMAERDPYLEAL